VAAFRIYPTNFFPMYLFYLQEFKERNPLC
jgi:hypothetical protein